MKNRKQFIAEQLEKNRIEFEKREERQRKKYYDEIKDWDMEKLKEEVVNVWSAHTSWAGGISAGEMWDMFHDECRFCGLKYIGGDHTNCCDNCWEDNKNKTLEDLQND